MKTQTFSQVRKWWVGSLFLAMLYAGATEAVEEPDYFPLQVGNRWTYLRFPQYNPPPETLTVAIVDSQRINDNLYYRFSESEALFFIPTGKWLRKNTQGDVIEYNPVTQQECLRFRLTGEVDDKWVDCDGATWLIGGERAVDDIPYSTLLVRDRTAWVIGCACIGFGMRFIDGLGIADRGADQGDGYFAFDAVINGKPFPRSPDTLIRENGWGVIKAMFLSLRR